MEKRPSTPARRYIPPELVSYLVDDFIKPCIEIEMVRHSANMAPRKKQRVLKSQQPATEKKMLLDCSAYMFPSSSANMAEPQTEEKKASSSSSMTPDWTQVPEELLHIITEKLDNCFSVIHARSVCRWWRSTFPFPDSLLRPSYSLPAFGDPPSILLWLTETAEHPAFLLV